MIFINQL